MTALLTRVKSRLYFHARRRSRGSLDGEYAAVYSGRSLDFDDLRGYVAGDEIRDIDWKATARHGSPLVRRYLAMRKQHVLLVADTGRELAAAGADGGTKKDTAVLALGVFGYLAVKHGDLVGLVTGDVGGTRGSRFRDSEGHLESLLRVVDAGGRADGKAGDLDRHLAHVAGTYRRRMLLVVVIDEAPFTATTESLLRRLRAQHEIVCLQLADLDLTAGSSDVHDVGGTALLPAALRTDPRLADEYAADVDARRRATESALSRLSIPHRRVDSAAAVIPAIYALLEGQRRARAR